MSEQRAPHISSQEKEDIFAALAQQQYEESVARTRARKVHVLAGAAIGTTLAGAIFVSLPHSVQETVSDTVRSLFVEAGNASVENVNNGFDQVNGYSDTPAPVQNGGNPFGFEHAAFHSGSPLDTPLSTNNQTGTVYTLPQGVGFQVGTTTK